jgi:hypothetical protein
VIILLILGALLVGCDVSYKVHHDARESWDQGTLKRHDVGCPTAVYVAPNGNLVEC